MRPIGTAQSYLEAPFNRILGTEASVRILRVLTHDGALSLAALARQTGLTGRGVREAVRTLDNLGMVAFLGTGTRGQLVALSAHPLVEFVTTLFQSELGRWVQLVDELRGLFRAAVPSPASAWIGGKAARKLDQPEDRLEIGVLAAAGEIEDLRVPLIDSLEDIEERFGVLTELQMFTRADLRVLPASRRKEIIGTVVLLHGPEPSALLTDPGALQKRGTAGGTQQDADRRNLEAGRALARSIETDPKVLENILEAVKHRILTAPPRLAHDLREWHKILANGSKAQIKHVLTGLDETATRLRQTILSLPPTAARRPRKKANK